MEHALVLDPAIRNWVVLPMIILMTLVGLGRAYGQQIMRPDPKIGQKEFDEIRYKQTIGRAERLRTMGNLINKRAWNGRKTFLYNKKPKAKESATADIGDAEKEDADFVKGLLQEKVPGAVNPMTSGDPSAMVDMLKNQAIFMVPNFAMMSFVNYFFQGFVCLKVRRVLEAYACAFTCICTCTRLFCALALCAQPRGYAGTRAETTPLPSR